MPLKYLINIGPEKVASFSWTGKYDSCISTQISDKILI